MSALTRGEVARKATHIGVGGLALGGPRLPWNSKKSWTGFVAMAAFGALGAAVLAAWTLGRPIDRPLVALSAAVALACALAESVPTTLDDNVTVPLVGAIAV